MYTQLKHKVIVIEFRNFRINPYLTVGLFLLKMKKYRTKELEENIVEDLLYEYNVVAKPFLKWVGGK